MKLKILATMALLLVSQGCASDSSRLSNSDQSKKIQTSPSVTKTSGPIEIGSKQQSTSSFTNSNLSSGNSTIDGSSARSFMDDDLDLSSSTSDSLSGSSSASGTLVDDSQKPARYRSSPKPGSFTGNPLKAPGSDQSRSSLSRITQPEKINQDRTSFSSRTNRLKDNTNIGATSNNKQQGDSSWQNQFNFDSSRSDKSSSPNSSQNNNSQSQSSSPNSSRTNNSQNQSSFGEDTQTNYSQNQSSFDNSSQSNNSQNQSSFRESN